MHCAVVPWHSYVGGALGVTEWDALGTYSNSSRYQPINTLWFVGERIACQPLPRGRLALTLKDADERCDVTTYRANRLTGSEPRERCLNIAFVPVIAR